MDVVILVLSTRRAHLRCAAINAVAAAGAEVVRTEVLDRGESGVVLRLRCRLAAGESTEPVLRRVESDAGCRVIAVESETVARRSKRPVTPTSSHVFAGSEMGSSWGAQEAAGACLAIAAEPSRTRDLTVKGNAVAVVTDGSAVQQLGNIGAAASLPVVEHEAARLARIGGINAWPIALDTQSTDGIVQAIAAIAPGFGAVYLTGISTPKRFDVLSRLGKHLDIPVFDDELHGTAVAVLVVAKNAARLLGKDFSRLTISISPAGHVARSVVDLLVAAGATGITSWDGPDVDAADSEPRDSNGVPRPGDVRAETLSGMHAGALDQLDLAVVLSDAAHFAEGHLAKTADRAVVCAIDPSQSIVDVWLCERGRRAASTANSHSLGQINCNVASPGILRGLLDAGISVISDDVLVAAADEIVGAQAPFAASSGRELPGAFEGGLSERVAMAVGVAVASRSS